MLTGETRYRFAMFGKLILQVKYSCCYDDNDPREMRMTTRWRDAVQDDLSELELFTNKGWIKVEDSLPQEVGRYWCYVEEQTERGLSSYEWNCSYNPDGKEFRDKDLVGRVTHWRELMGTPLDKNK